MAVKEHIKFGGWAVGLGTMLAIALAAPIPAAPPLLEGLGSYRIVDASGAIAPRVDVSGADRVTLRPAYPPSPLLRARPMFVSGYAGAYYGPPRTPQLLAPTGYYAGHKHSHHSGWLSGR